jgi:hypothetical protein
LQKAAQKLFCIWALGFGNTNAHDPDSEKSFCFCLLLIHPKPMML